MNLLANPIQISSHYVIYLKLYKYNDIIMKYDDIFQLYLNKKNWLNLIKRVALCFAIGNHTGVYTYD